MSFSAEPYETCFNPNGTSNRPPQELCTSAVSISAEYDNMECQDLCKQWANSEITYNTFTKLCQFEMIKTSKTHIVLGGDCFTDIIMGHTDDLYTDVPVVYHDVDVESPNFQIIYRVPSPIDCQMECQQNILCSNFLYRAIRSPNWDGEVCSPNWAIGHEACPPNTCILQAYTKPLTFNLGGGAAETGWSGCHIRRSREYWRLQRGMTASYTDWGLATSDRYEECIWKSSEHVTGPKYCPAESFTIAAVAGTANKTPDSAAAPPLRVSALVVVLAVWRGL
eukprot:GHVO01013273.1.p1 GENE.GHVO01013273.1~~GHVO01013273.1.p1  ORF type:complete len:280 (-),score=37.97 GHVO01013273.1:135-974(-)